MPTIKEHIEVVKSEIDKNGKRLETETLSADQLIEIGNRMALLGSTMHWLQATDNLNGRIKNPLIKSIN